MKVSKNCSPGVRERAVRMVFQHEGEHASQWAAIAGKIGCTPETLRLWSRWAEYDAGRRAGYQADKNFRFHEINPGVRSVLDVWVTGHRDLEPSII
jgi:transposase